MATGTSRTVSAPVFHGDDPEQITGYRTLSVLAIISFVIGLIAPVAYAAPFLLVVPFVGIAVSLLALRQIAVSDGVLAGRWAATFGLVLSIASALVPFSHNFVQRAMRVNEAETFGRKWVAMVASGDLKQAFSLTIDGVRPAPPPEPDAPPKPAPYDAFINQPIIKSLQAAGEKADIRIRDTVDYQVTTYRSMVIRQLYAVTPTAATPAAGGGQPIEFVLSVQRATLQRQTMSRWMVARFDPPQAAGSSPTGN